MKCGDKGHTTSNGAPCQQNVGAAAAGCIWHTSSPEERSILALKGSITSRMKRALPASYKVLPFDSREAIIAFAHEMATQALKGDCDPRRVDIALRACAVALTAFAQQTQERLVDALLTMEHGGVALMLLQRLGETPGTGTKKALPGRVLSFPAPDGAGQQEPGA